MFVKNLAFRNRTLPAPRPGSTVGGFSSERSRDVQETYVLLFLFFLFIFFYFYLARTLFGVTDILVVPAELLKGTPRMCSCAWDFKALAFLSCSLKVRFTPRAEFYYLFYLCYCIILRLAPERTEESEIIGRDCVYQFVTYDTDNHGRINKVGF